MKDGPDIAQLESWLTEALDRSAIEDAEFRRVLGEPVAEAHFERIELPWLSAFVAAPDHPAVKDIALAAAGITFLLRVGLGLIDDLQDGDGVRPTDDAARQGMNQALGLLSVADSELMRLQSLVPAASLVQAAGEQARVILRLCAGQYRDLQRAIPPHTLEAYEAIVEAKTATFFELEARLPALLLGADSATGAALSEFGRAAGHLYQLANDYSGMVQPDGGGDVGREWTYPTIYTWYQATAGQRDQLSKAWREGSTHDVTDLAAQLGAPQFVILASAVWAQRARTALDSLTPVAGKAAESALEQLRDLVDHWTLRPQTSNAGQSEEVN